MTEGNRAFEILDPKLNMFALANGTDLVKEPGQRRLEWYRDGLDRGILITVSGDGTVSTTALAWKRGEESSQVRTQHRESMDPAHVAQHLSAIMDEAVDLANSL